jgi:hypothetical protein
MKGDTQTDKRQGRKLNSLLRYGITQHYIHYITQSGSTFIPTKPTKIRTVAIFKSFVKQKQKKVSNETNMSMTFCCTELHLSDNKLNGSLILPIKQNLNFKFQPHFVFVSLVFRKITSLNFVHSLNICHTRTFMVHTDWCKIGLCINVRSLNTRNFETVEATGLKDLGTWSNLTAWPPSY